VNLARLNHILIPPKKEGRDRLRRSPLLWLIRPVGWFFGALTSEGRILSVLTLLLGAAAMDVYGTRIYLLWSALVGLLGAGILSRYAYRLKNVRLELRAPERVSVGAPLRFTVVVHNDGAEDHAALRVVGPFLPWDGRWLGEQPVFAHLRAGQSVSGEVRATFVERGDHHLDEFGVSALVPFGLALGPSSWGEGCRFRVVPRLAPVERVTLPLSQCYQPGGIAQASRIGEAMELVGVRPYRRGDPVRDLHALTWARTGVPHVREYQQEYFSRVGVIVDNDRTVSTEAGLEAAVSLAAGVVACLSRGEALIDVLVVDGQVHPLTLGRSLGHLDQALDVLAGVTPGNPLDPGDLLARLTPFLGQLSSVVLITEAPFRAHDDRRAKASCRARQLLVRALEDRGVTCRVLRVTKRKGPAAQGDPREQLVSIAAIRGAEPLSL